LTTEEKLETIRANKARLDRRAAAQRAAIDAYTAEARELGLADKRAAAIAALQRKAEYERQLKTTTDLARNMSQQLEAIETTIVSADVARSMTTSATVMSEAHATLNVDAVTSSMVDMRLKSRETKHATALMTRPLFDYNSEDEDDERDDEHAALEAELSALLMGAEAAPNPPASSQSLHLSSSAAPKTPISAGGSGAAQAPVFPAVPSTKPTKTAREIEREELGF
jgi:charged multivesicular body protein 4